MAKSKWESHVKDKLVLIEGWARDGLTDEQVAKNLGIAYSTFREYKNKYSALSTSLKKGKEVADYEVENALFNRAIGYYYDEVKKGPTGTITTTKHIPGDVGAMAFWLKNRRPDKWRDRIKEDNTQDNEIKIEIVGAKDES